MLTCVPLTCVIVPNTSSISACCEVPLCGCGSRDKFTEVPFAKVTDRSVCNRSGMLRSRFRPVVELAVTVRGKTPLDIVTLALFKAGTKVQVAPAVQLRPGSVMAAVVLFTNVIWGLAYVMVRLV